MLAFSRAGAFIRSLFAGAALLFLANPSPVLASAQEITILHVNDTHSHLDAWGPKDANLHGTLGGLPKAATLVATEKALNPDALFVHAGDLFNGDLFFNEYLGVPELLLLQGIGLDVMAIGNHEFQFGPDFLVGVLDAAWPGGGGGVSIVGTNLDLGGYPALGAWVGSTVIKEAGGVKVGFFGLTTPDDPLELPEQVVIRSDFAAVSASAVTSLRAQGAQVVVCLGHLGLDVSRALAAAVPGIDVIVNGHDHVALSQPETIAQPAGRTTLIVSAGEFYRWVGRLRLSVNDAGAVSLVDYALLGADAGVAPFAPVQAQVDGLRAGIIARYGDVYFTELGWADATISGEFDDRHAKRDTPLGNLFTDAYRARTGKQIAIEADGFLEQELVRGPIVAADVFRSMPYGFPDFDAAADRLISRPFRLANFRLTGAALLAALETALAGPGAVFPQVSGMRFDYDASKPPR